MLDREWTFQILIFLLFFKESQILANKNSTNSLDQTCPQSRVWFIKRNSFLKSFGHVEPRQTTPPTIKYIFNFFFFWEYWWHIKEKGKSILKSTICHKIWEEIKYKIYVTNPNTYTIAHEFDGWDLSTSVPFEIGHGLPKIWSKGKKKESK